MLRMFSSQRAAFRPLGALVRGYAAAADGPVQRTALYDFHVAHGGKMVPFAGWSMPVQYEDQGLIASHTHTRENASVFDVSHMLQTRLSGKGATAFLERLTVADVAGISLGQAKLTVFTNERGGIGDDLMITNAGDHYYVVSNAGCADKDLAHMRKHLGQYSDVKLEVLSEKLSLLALQGPKAAIALKSLVSFELKDLEFMHGRDADVAGIKGCRITRCGYTGEDGFEIAVPHARAVELAEALLSRPDVKLAGLGPRDSLRLEAGLCLYGNDIDDTTTPIEAGLTWLIGKRRRTEGGFIGDKVILDQLKTGASRLRVGLVVSGAPARGGAEVVDESGAVVGKVTSGSPSPTLKQNIAMAYVPKAMSARGTKVGVLVRGKRQDAVVAKMPFVPQRYYQKA